MSRTFHASRDSRRTDRALARQRREADIYRVERERRNERALVAREYDRATVASAR